MWSEREQEGVVEVQLEPDALGRRLLWFAIQPRRRLLNRRTCFLGVPCVSTGGRGNMITSEEEGKLRMRQSSGKASSKLGAHKESSWLIAAQLHLAF